MARRTKYYFNNETLSYEKIERSAMYRLRQTFFYSFTIVSLAVVFAIVLFYVVPSPSEKATRNENQQLKFQYEILSNEMDVMLDVMLDIQQRDDNLYRILFQAEPFPKEKRELSDGSDYKYSDYANLNSSKILINTSKKADRLAKMIYAQTESFDEIVYLSEINEKKLQYIPAIQPILNKDLTRIASGFGYRTDPVYRTRECIKVWILQHRQGLIFMLLEMVWSLHRNGSRDMVIRLCWIMDLDIRLCMLIFMNRM